MLLALSDFRSSQRLPMTFLLVPSFFYPVPFSHLNFDL